MLVVVLLCQVADATLASRKLQKFGYECKGVGGFIFIDFICRFSVTEADAVASASCIEEFVRSHFLVSFEELPHFQRFFVQAIEDDEGCRLIRVTIFFSHGVDPCVIMEKIGLPPELQTDHVINELKADIRVNLSIPDLIDNHRTILSKQLAMNGLFSCAVSRKVFGRLFQQISNIKEAKIRKEVKKRRSLANEKKRLLELHTKKSFGVFDSINIHNDNLMPTELSEDEKEALKQCEVLSSVAAFMEGTKSMNVALKFKSCEDLLLKNKWILDYIGDQKQISTLLSEKGGLTRIIASLQASYGKEILEMIELCLAREKETVESEKKRREKEEKEKLEREIGMRKVRRRQGLIPEGVKAKPKWGKLSEDAVQALRAERAASESDEKQSLDAYESITNTLLGVYSIRFEAGTMALCLNFDGFDIFDIFPRREIQKNEEEKENENDDEEYSNTEDD